MRAKFVKNMGQNFRAPATWVFASILIVGFVVNVSPADTKPSATVTSDAADDKLQAEGTKVTKLTGTFRQASGRISFVPRNNSKNAFVCLENLMLQRVATVILQDQEYAEWTISGEFTEYQGGNYLILRAAQRVE